MPPDRVALLQALAGMPDEAFSWFVSACRARAMLHGANTQIWPDGTGGFLPASREAIAAVQRAAADWLDAAK